MAQRLFAAGVNQLDSIQRVRISEDDVNGPQTDYLTDIGVTNELAVMTPYAVTFRAFSPEIAQTLAGFASSPDGFIVTGINVQPASATGMEVASFAMRQYGGGPEGGALQPLPTPGAVPARGGPQTALQEQLLRATIEVEIVKLLPKK